MHYLSNERTERAAGLNDRAFRTEWAARTDRDGRRDRFQDGYSGLNLAAVCEYGLHRFRNSVTFDLRRAVLRHDADHEASNDRNENHPWSEMVEPRIAETKRKVSVECDIGEQADQFVQQKSDAPCYEADEGGEKRYGYDAETGRFGSWPCRSVYASDPKPCLVLADFTDDRAGILAAFFCHPLLSLSFFGCRDATVTDQLAQMFEQRRPLRAQLGTMVQRKLAQDLLAAWRQLQQHFPAVH